MKRQIYIFAVIAILLTGFSINFGYCSTLQQGKTENVKIENSNGKISELVKELTEKNKKIKDFRAKFTGTAKLGFISLPLAGEVLYKRPDRIRVKFSNLPSILSEQKDTFKAFVPSPEKLDEKQCKYCGIEKMENMKSYHVIQVIPEKKQNLKESTIKLAVETLNPEFMQIVYNDGSLIDITNIFSPNISYTLPAEQKADLQMSMMRIKLDIIYQKYILNSNIPDSEFK